MIPPTFLLDTNSCIYVLSRSKPALDARIQQCEPRTVALSAVVVAELAMGFRGVVELERARFERFLGLFPILPFDEAAARAYATVPFRRGKLDRLIAAHAVAIGATLITNNVRDFADVPDLKLEDWTL